MQIEMGNGFWWDMTIVPCVRCHDVSEDMDADSNGFPLGGGEIQPMQDEAQKDLGIVTAYGSHFPIRRGVPLEEIAFRFEVLVFRIGASGENTGNFSVCFF